MTQFISAYTLVDITNTQKTKVRDSNTIEYHQQQNLNVLLQTVGLRAQPLEPNVSVLTNVDLSEFDFDDSYNGKSANVWRLIFHVDQEYIWSDGQDHVAYLKTDAHGIAVTGDLDNSFDFDTNIFDTQDCINLYFKLTH